MKQLLLDIRPDMPPQLENFVCGDNGEALQSLKDCIAGHGHLLLWGELGCGRSHLLHAAVQRARQAGREACYLPSRNIDTDLPVTPGLLLAVDDLEQLSPKAQVALFNAFNRATGLHQTLLLAAHAPPLELKLREDLRTRVGQCLGYELKLLDDETRAEILNELARRRGLSLSDDIVNFLLRHGRRELPHLVKVLDALDQASLERKRRITLPLLRELMQQGLDL